MKSLQNLKASIQVKSHKLVIASSSPIFHDLLAKNPHPYPLIYLKGTSLQDLQALLSFAYYGKVELEQERLESFLKAAEEFQVKGLTKGKEGDPLHQMHSDTSQIEEDNDRHQPQDLDFCSLASPAEDQTNGDVVNENLKQPLLYRDPALPMGWYIKVERTHIAKHRYYVETCFFSPDGARLKSQADVSKYLEKRLWVRDKSHRPPVPVAEMPWKDDLTDLDKMFVPTLKSLTNIEGNRLRVNLAAADDMQGIQVSALPVGSDPNNSNLVRSTDVDSSSALENNNSSQSQDCDQQKVTYTVTSENGLSQTYVMICTKTLDQNTLVETLMEKISNDPDHKESGRKTIKITQHKYCVKKSGKKGQTTKQRSGNTMVKKTSSAKGDQA